MRTLGWINSVRERMDNSFLINGEPLFIELLSFDYYGDPLKKKEPSCIHLKGVLNPMFSQLTIRSTTIRHQKVSFVVDAFSHNVKKRYCELVLVKK